MLTSSPHFRCFFYNKYKKNYLLIWNRLFVNKCHSWIVCIMKKKIFFVDIWIRNGGGIMDGRFVRVYSGLWTNTLPSLSLAMNFLSFLIHTHHTHSVYDLFLSAFHTHTDFVTHTFTLTRSPSSLFLNHTLTLSLYRPLWLEEKFRVKIWR